MQVTARGDWAVLGRAVLMASGVHVTDDILTWLSEQDVRNAYGRAHLYDLEAVRRDGIFRQQKHAGILL